MSITETSILAPAREKIAQAERTIREAIGSLEMTEDRHDRALLTGYTGSSALKELREAVKNIERARKRLDLLGGP